MLRKVLDSGNGPVVDGVRDKARLVRENVVVEEMERHWWKLKWRQSI